jgi:hypothetical protein
LALRPLAVGGAFATLCDRPAGLSSATRQPRSNGRNTRGRAAPRLHAAPHQPPHLPATCWASSTLSVVSPRGQESRKPETLPRLALQPQPRARGPHSRGAGHGRRPRCRWSPLAPPRQVRPPAPRSTPRRPHRGRAASDGSSPTHRPCERRITTTPTDEPGHVSCGPFDQRRRDGAADPARRHGLAVRNPGLRSIPPPVPMAATWWWSRSADRTSCDRRTARRSAAGLSSRPGGGARDHLERASRRGTSATGWTLCSSWRCSLAVSRALLMPYEHGGSLGEHTREDRFSR